ncbi:MAG: cellulase family glycosylhydrolase, partial [Limisphaerales bacterium]
MSFPSVPDPIPPPEKGRSLGGGLAHFDSPYLGHTGSWDGKGGAMFGHSKTPDLDIERDMGLHWTFMPVYWRALERDGPVDLDSGTPAEWQELDGFVIAAQKRGLNILMQAPVMGGNAGGPPKWAGQLKSGRSAPTNMAAAAAFAGKLAARYCPGGTLARQQKWGDHYGVRAWELDNEPESYLTSWKNQAHEYAEFVTKAAAAIKKLDPQAVIVCPGMAGGEHGLPWLEQALAPGKDPSGGLSIGPVTDVVSFHCYEGLETAILRKDRTIEQDLMDVRAVFRKGGRAAPGFEYAPKQDFWHTEGNFDFLGVLSKQRRAAWRFQFFTRAFAAGIR